MANLVITSTTKTIEVAFNNFAVPTGRKFAAFRKSFFAGVDLQHDEECVWLYLDNRDKYTATFQYDVDHPTFLIIDSVDGVVPTDNQDLYNKLKALLPM